VNRWNACGGIGLLLWGLSTPAFAQLPGGAGPVGSSRPVPLPLSGREGAGEVSVQQMATSSGAETVTSSTQIGGSFQGSVPGEIPPPGTVTLTLGEAVRRGLQTNLGAVTANYSARMASATFLSAQESRASWIPSIMSGFMSSS